MNAKLLRILLLPLAFAFVAPLRADEPKKEEPKKVKFDMLPSQHIVVKVKINGTGPYRLVFDTGAPIMLITNRLAKEAEVITKGNKAPSGLFGAVGAQYPIKEFAMGDLKAEGVPTMVMDHPTLAQMEKLFGRIDGIVGFTFFARYRMTIDYQAKELTFVPTDFKPISIFDALMAIMMKSPSERDNKITFLAPGGSFGLVADKGTQDDEAGIDIKKVFKDGPAAKAGLEAGDRLLTLDGRWTDTIVDLYEAASHAKPGQAVPLQILRKGNKMELKVTPVKGL